MPKKSRGIPRKTGKSATPSKSKKPALRGVDESNIDNIEQETINRANKTLSALEVAIAAWDASDKPEEKKTKFMRYRWLHEALTEWEKKVLLAAGKKQSYEMRLQRLQEFAVIFHSYAGR